MDLQPVDYLSGLGQLPDALGAMNKQQAFQVGLDSARAEAEQRRAEAAAQQQQLAETQAFQRDLQGVSDNPSPQNVSALMMKHPAFADKIKESWDVKDKAASQADLTQLGSIYSAAAGGNWKLAAQVAHQRHDSDKASGQTDPSDDAMLDTIDKAAQGDTEAQKAALGVIGIHLAGATGPEHFGTVYGALKGGYTLDAGAARYDENGNMVAHSPFITRPSDGALVDWESTMGGAAGKGGDTSAGGSVGPAAASVASALSASGLPAPVVAGFMGNFSAEGGYTGAQGDGGSASGIGQWRGERAANFEKVTGKPVTEATPADQAQFVAWEMKNPEAAGMTVSQRDQILAAKTPAQAAALIDKFYERSDGSARQKRMAAATAFAGDTGAQSSGPRVLLPGKQGDQFENVTGDKAKALGLDPNTIWKVNSRTKEATKLSDVKAPDGPEPQEIQDAATQYLLTGQMPALGNGAAGIKQQILKARSQLMQRVGIKAEQLPAYQAQYAADKTALQQSATLLSSLESSENALKANGQQVWNTHRQLVQDGIISTNPFITRQRLKYYANFGTPDEKAHVKAYLDSVNAYSTEYSKFMTAANGMGGSAAPSDSARTQSGELNDPGLQATPLLAHLRQGLIEAKNRRNGVAQQKQHLEDKLSSYLHPHDAPAASSPLPEGAKVVGTYHGKRVIELNGHRMVEQ